MLRRHYGIRLPVFLGIFAIWSLGTIVWVRVRPEAPIWGLIKWIMIALFSPIGVVLLGSLLGYRIDFDGQVLRFGFFPFVRKLHVNGIGRLRTGGFAMSIWRAEDVFRVVTLRDEMIGIPCHDAKEISPLVKPYLREYEDDE
jgi:hypothetical protein